MGPKAEPDTKTNWSTDRRWEDKLNSTQQLFHSQNKKESHHPISHQNFELYN
jgi:hypothetical protein